MALTPPTPVAPAVQLSAAAELCGGPLKLDKNDAILYYILLYSILFYSIVFYYIIVYYIILYLCYI